MQIFVIAPIVTAERTGLRGISSNGRQSSHAQANQLRRPHADKFGQRTVDAQHAELLIMHYDVIGNGIENLGPLAAGLRNPRKQSGIFQSHRSMADQGLQQVQIIGGKLTLDVGQAEHSQQISLMALQAHQSQVFPAQAAGEVLAQGLNAAAGDLQFRMFFGML